ncbi:hypothetical protein NE237_025158 [Protea cynaroides]|uniref:Uncharacterized protein n=1 Tax=Protea cynaroides TaxID=273540 RepID=A0A9Q0H5M6_9MAGN|nr:hypothetical protein NE237_025158 [Protea cynaroides]
MLEIYLTILIPHVLECIIVQDIDNAVRIYQNLAHFKSIPYRHPDHQWVLMGGHDINEIIVPKADVSLAMQLLERELLDLLFSTLNQLFLGLFIYELNDDREHLPSQVFRPYSNSKAFPLVWLKNRSSSRPKSCSGPALPNDSLGGLWQCIFWGISTGAMIGCSMPFHNAMLMSPK